IALTVATGVTGTRTTLTNNGTITSAGSVNAIGSNGNDFITITNNGTVNNTSTGRALRLDESVTVTNNGQISSAASDGLRLGINGTVTNNGTISSAATNGDRAFQVDSGATVTNASAGTITATGTGDAARINGGTFTNNGVVTSAADDAIDIGVATAVVTVHNYGRVTAGDKGVNSDITTGTLTVTNYSTGTITGTDTGIAGQTGTVTNYGRVVGLTDDGMDFDGIATITNTGTVTCSAAAGTTPTGPDSADGITLGGGTVTNSGTISSDHNGIYGVISASAATPTAAGATTIVNTGTITGTAGYGVRLFGTFNDTLENSGTIIGGIGTAIDMGAGNDSITITGGRIDGLINGGDGTDTVTFNLGAGNSFKLQNNIINCETVSLTSGTLEISGSSISTSLTAAAGTGLKFDLTRGASAITGTVTLGGTLTLAQVSGFSAGTSLILLNNDGTDAITGTFAGIGEGGVVAVDGGEYRISYAGGTGNDLVLTVLKAPTIAVPTVVVPIPPIPPVIPTFVERTADGVTVTTKFGTLPSGAASHTITVPTVAAGRVNNVGLADVADIALISDTAGTSLLTVQLPTGLGLTSIGSAASLSASNGASDFAAALSAAIGTTAKDLSGLTSDAQAYFSALSTNNRVIVETITQPAPAR
ncbi:hypothetical protein VZ95_07065, partial [Elstera litoralis]